MPRHPPDELPPTAESEIRDWLLGLLADAAGWTHEFRDPDTCLRRQVADKRLLVVCEPRSDAADPRDLIVMVDGVSLTPLLVSPAARLDVLAAAIRVAAAVKGSTPGGRAWAAVREILPPPAPQSPALPPRPATPGSGP